MKKSNQLRTLCITLSLISVFLMGCENNLKEVQKSTFSEFMPSGDAEKINLKYTDSGKITAILLSKKMLDFDGIEFPFTEFPKGIDLTLVDKKGKTTFVRADWATTYKSTGIIDLQRNVKITSEAGEVMETEQLYFDQKKDWFYTERKFKFLSPKGNSEGQGIDFSKDFRELHSQRISGDITSSNNP